MKNLFFIAFLGRLYLKKSLSQRFFEALPFPEDSPENKLGGCPQSASTEAENIRLPKKSLSQNLLEKSRAAFIIS